jgi:hypothetical protein
MQQVLDPIYYEFNNSIQMYQKKHNLLYVQFITQNIFTCI